MSSFLSYLHELTLKAKGTVINLTRQYSHYSGTGHSQHQNGLTGSCCGVRGSGC